MRYRVDPKDTEIWDTHTQSLKSTHPDFASASIGGGYHGPDDFFIPTFQRGIEWSWEKLQECVASRSPLLGEVTLGVEAQQPGKIQLLDGLQRFAAFTALSNALRDVLFAPDDAAIDAMVLNGPLDPANSTEAKTLRLVGQSESGAAPVLIYNDIALRNHRRAVLKDTYSSFAKGVSDQVATALGSNDPAAQEFVRDCALFYRKYMWANLYQTFNNHHELVSAFVGWNAIRIELGLADLCRAALINRGSEAGWTHMDFVSAEDRFNSLLLESGGNHKKHYGPFFTLLHDDWFKERRFNIIPELAQPKPTWAQVDDAFSRLAEVIDYFDGSSVGADAQKQEYIRFLKLLGDLPFITALLHCCRHATKKKRTSIDTLVQIDVLHKLAVAYMRRLLDSSIGNTGAIAEDVLKGSLTVKQWLAAVVPPKSGTFGQKPDAAWLRLRLENAGIASAKAIMTACLLPKAQVQGGSRQWGKGSFLSLFVRAGGRPKWSLDHIIPKANFRGKSVGDAYQDSLRNLAPVLTKDNSSFNRMDANTKVQDTVGNWYGKYRQGGTTDRLPNGVPHPFHDHLFLAQGTASPADLNAIDQLAGGVGTARIEIFHKLLMERL